MTQRERRSQGPKLRIDNEVTRRIRQHARAHIKTEVCGILIGEMRSNAVEVQHSIEALNAAQAGTHVTFTQDAWETIYKVKDESYPEKRIVGWYHSHPGFGVFLSDHDTFIHRNFFSSPDQVAWVYDPHSDEEGCFGWIDSALHRISSISVLDNNGDGIERTPRESDVSQIELEEGSLARVHPEQARHAMAPWIRLSLTVATYLSVLLLGFVISWLLFPHFVAIPVDPHTGQPLVLQDDPGPSVPPRTSSGAGTVPPVSSPPVSKPAAPTDSRRSQ